MSGVKISYIIIVAILFIWTSCTNNNGIPETVTFTEHVAPVLYNNCTVCHRPGGTSHFSLVTYQDAKYYASSIAYVAKEHLMPPMPADPNYTRFVGEHLLTDRDIQILIKWADEGAPEGPSDKLPALPQYAMGSLIGKPDLRLALPPIFRKANSIDTFLIIKVPFELPRDTFASVIEFVPGNNNLVHHVNGDMVKYEFDKKKDVFTGERVVPLTEDNDSLIIAYQRLGLPNDDGTYPLLERSVVNYLPGAFGQKYPEGIGGYALPRKGAFRLSVHYGFTSKQDVWDSSYINIFFGKRPSERPVLEFQLGTLGESPVMPDLVIQPNTIKQVYSRYVVPIDISILTINPHMHLLGKSFKAYALKPNGDTIRLISIPRWDFNWQYFYTFPKMVHIPKGSIIVAEGVYDNTRANLNNPFSPPRLVRDNNGSMKSTDEMFQFIITYLPYRQGDENISLEAK